MPSPLRGRRGEGGSSPTADVCPLFVEQASNLLAPNGAMWIVVPLSITFGSNSRLTSLRAAMAEWDADSS